MPAFKKSILARMRRNGISVNAIAWATGTSASAVSKALRDLGIASIKPIRAPSKKPAVQVVGARQQVADVVPRAARSWFEV